MTKNIFAWLAIATVAMITSSILVMVTKSTDNTLQQKAAQTEKNINTKIQIDSIDHILWKKHNAMLLDHFIKNADAAYDTTALHIVDPWDCLQLQDTLIE